MRAIVAAGLACWLALVASGCGAAPDRAQAAAVVTPADHVLAISIDGLNTDAIRQLGRAGLPNLHRLLDEGASTLNARSSVEKTQTLPNHAGMITGRRVKADLGGHGVNINGYSDTTVHELAGHDVDSIFEVAHDAGLDTALYAGKDKFDLFQRSWPAHLDTFVVDENLATLAAAVRGSLATDPPDLVFLHMNSPDLAGHRYGFMSAPYLDAVRSVDAELGWLLAAIEGDPALSDGLAIVLTADHGGPVNEKNHNRPTTLANYRVPFAAWGAGTVAGDLYERNPDFRDPGTSRPLYRNAQPVRNVNLANLSMALLGLPSVPGSGIDAAQALDVD